MDPRFPAGLPFPVPEILEFVAFGDSGKFFQQFSRDFPGTFLQNSCKDPRNSHSLLEFSELWTTVMAVPRINYSYSYSARWNSERTHKSLCTITVTVLYFGRIK